MEHLLQTDVSAAQENKWVHSYQDEQFIVFRMTLISVAVVH